MQFTDQQITIIGNLLPGILRAARRTDHRVHSVGIGRAGGGIGEDHAIVFFVTSKGDPLNPLNIDRSLRIVIDGDSVEVMTDIVETSMPTFAAVTYCDGTRPAEGGDCVATYGTGLSGTLGGAVVAPDKTKHYLVSAAHLLTKYGAMPQGSIVIHPANDGNATIGTLANVGPKWPASPFGGDMEADAALALIDHPQEISYTIIDIGEIAGTDTPSEKMDLLVRGAGTGQKKNATILYFQSATTVMHGQGEYTFTHAFFTPLISVQGDSGALAIEAAGGEPRKVVGLLFAQSDKFTIFADVNDCIDVLKISGWYWGRPPA